MRVIGVAALLGIVVTLLFLLLNWYIAPTEPADKKDLVLALAQILGGTALLSGLYFTWRTVQVNREGQITERFTRAIDQLGSKELEIRLGGIYALERIARDSERDHWTIMEVLTAYVRQHAPWSPEAGQEIAEDAALEKLAYLDNKSEVDLGRESESTRVSPPDPDIQAIMTVLRRRTRSFYYGGEPEPLDLHATNLQGVNLERTNFREANLAGSYFRGANLRYANFEGASLRGADFSGAELWSANLSHADLDGGAKLRGADLMGAKLRGAHLRGADLSGATLRRAYLDANCQGADFSGADLWEAELSGRLEGANLSGTDLSETLIVHPAELEKTVGDENTKLPSYLKRPAHWRGKTDEQSEGD